MISAKITSNSEEVSIMIKQMVKNMPKVIHRALAEVTAYEVGAIKKRTTEKGIDAYGKRFTPYSTKYKRASVKQSGVVDLTDKGHMMGNLSTKITPSKGMLFFSRSVEAKKAMYHNNIGVGKKKITRKFFMISKKESKIITNKFFKNIKKGLKL